MRGFPIRSTALFICACLALLGVTGCDTGSDSSGSNASSASSSTSSGSSTSTSSSGGGFERAEVQVLFPPVSSSTTAAAVTVRGSVREDAEVAQVFVNGEAVTVDATDGSWQYQAALTAGANVVSVTYDTTAGDTLTATTLNIAREYALISPQQFALDESGNRLLVLDAAQRAVLSVDATSGARTLLAPAAGADNLIDNPLALAFAPDAAQLLVYQNSEEPFMLIGASDGSQMVAESQPLAGIELTNDLQALAYDAAGEYVVADIERVLLNEDGERVTDEEEGSPLFRSLLYHYNPVTGVKSAITLFDQPDTELALAGITDLATTPDSPYIYVLDRVLSPATLREVPRVIRVAKSDGSRTLILPARTEEDQEPIEGSYNLLDPSHISLDADGESIFVLDDSELIEVDLATFAGVEVSGAEVPEDGAFNLLNTIDMTLNASANQVYTLSDSFNRIVQVATASGERTVLSANLAENGITFAQPRSLAINRTRNEVYVADPRRLRVFDLSLETGEKSVLLESIDADDDGQIDSLLGYPLAVESDQGQRVFTLDDLNTLYRGSNFTSSAYPRLYTIDVESKTTTAIVGFNSRTIILKDLSFDPVGNHIYVVGGFPVSPAPRTLDVIYRVDLSTSPASNRVFSGSGTPDSDFQFNTLRSVAWDAAGDRLLAVDSGLNALFAIDGDDGSRSILSGMGIPAASEFDFELPMALTIDPSRNRALVIDTALQALISVDLTTGERAILFTNEFFAQARDVELFNELDYLLVTSVLSNRVDAFDLATGESVTLSY